MTEDFSEVFQNGITDGIEVLYAINAIYTYSIVKYLEPLLTYIYMPDDFVS